MARRPDKHINKSSSVIKTRNGRFLSEKRNFSKEYNYIRGLELFNDSDKYKKMNLGQCDSKFEIFHFAGNRH